MTAIFNYFEQFIQVLSTEPPKISECCATYLRAYPDMVYVIDGSSSTKVFMIPEVMKCFTYIYPNRYCSLTQFRNFGKIMNEYYKCQLSSTGLFNELKNGQARNVTPVFPVYWYVIATMPMFEEPEQRAEEVEEIKEAKEAKAVEEVKAVKEVKEEDSDSDSDDYDSCKTVCPDDSDDSDDDVYVSPNVSFIEDDSDDFDY